jgi:hypothetical protein
MEFTHVDPFAMSEESDLDEAKRQQQQSSEDNINNEEDVFFPSSRAHHHSSDDDVRLAIPKYSKHKPRGRSNGTSKRPTRKQHSPNWLVEREQVTCKGFPGIVISCSTKEFG